MGLKISNGVEEIALRCESATYETVWVENRDGRLVISDRGETCQYLNSGDGAHRHLPLETIRQLCGEQRAELVDVPEMWPHITVPSGQRAPLAEAVAIVGRAIEHVFAAALKVPHA